MASLKETQQDIEIISSIRNITSTYQTLANMRTNQIRDEVLRTRAFLKGVAKIYHHAKADYLASVDSNNLEQASFIRRNEKNVAVFLSANERFYGTLILNTWREVQNYLRAHTSDLVVTGDLGKRFVERRDLETELRYFDLDDEHPSSEQVKTILEFIKQYERIIVFHGRFKTAFKQQSAQTDISGGITLEETEQRESSYYLFEPSPEAILKFFEDEIIGALFNQTLLEHQLARFASRMVAMDHATQNADKKLDNLRHQAKLFKSRVQNKRQLDRIIRTKVING